MQVIKEVEIYPYLRHDYAGCNFVLNSCLHKKEINFRFKPSVEMLGMLAQTWLDGLLEGKGYHFNNVVFCPADTLQHVNTEGMPVYVFKVECGVGTFNYHMETSFMSKSDYYRTQAEMYD